MRFAAPFGRAAGKSPSRRDSGAAGHYTPAPFRSGARNRRARSGGMRNRRKNKKRGKVINFHFAARVAVALRARTVFCVVFLSFAAAAYAVRVFFINSR